MTNTRHRVLYFTVTTSRRFLVAFHGIENPGYSLRAGKRIEEKRQQFMNSEYSHSVYISLFQLLERILILVSGMFFFMMN